jgi:alpha-beta hydrolase superfamily lysophospholipase
MVKKNLNIKNIPSILWGNHADKLFIAIHGNMSHKADAAIALFAEEAVANGYQVLSFDLPEHGERKADEYPCHVQNCVHDLTVIMDYAQTISKNISIFACSMGAYFSLLAYKQQALEQVLFLSPVVNMERIIQNMMKWFDVSEEKLEKEKEIETPIGQTLYWDYYSYVKAHPINRWDKPTSILYGAKDDLCEYDVLTEFVKLFQCNLHIMENGEHFFHTKEQLDYFRNWIQGIL